MIESEISVEIVFILALYAFTVYSSIIINVYIYLYRSINNNYLPYICL